MILPNNVRHRLKQRWIGFWMRYAGLSRFGRLATRLAAWFVPPYKGRAVLAQRYAQGFVSPSASIHHSDLSLGSHIFIGDRATIYQQSGGGLVRIGNRVSIHNDTIFETGKSGSIIIGDHTAIQPRCQFSAYLAMIQIGAGVQIAPNCAFYPYDHGMDPGVSMQQQPLVSRGDIVIGDDAWLGYGVTVLSGVSIGSGAVVGAGSVVTRDIPAGAIAVGNPARVVRMRSDEEVTA